MTPRYKYPRTAHLPWSSGTVDDITSTTLPWDDDTEVVALEKLDGECTSIYADGYIHARSTTYSPHPSRDWLKGKVYELTQYLKNDEVLLGENVYAQHSIQYTDLLGYFYLFGMRNKHSFLSWDKVLEMAYLTDLPHPDILYQGPASGIRHDLIWRPHTEGYVIRTTSPFPVEEFHLNVRKYVRPNHVTTTDHWMHGSITRNQLR